MAAVRGYIKKMTEKNRWMDSIQDVKRLEATDRKERIGGSWRALTVAAETLTEL